MVPRGSYAFGWDQVTLDGVPGQDMAACRPGAAWRWTGRALRLDGPGHVLPLQPTAETLALRHRARRGAGRIVTPRMTNPVTAADDAGGRILDTPLAGPAITVTDGRMLWRVDLVPARRGSRGVAHVAALPPADVDLWIATTDRIDALAPAVSAPEWQGIAAGTPVDTPAGPVPVDRISPGMAVLTASGATVRVLRCSATRVSGARLCAVPDLAPVRIAPGSLGPGVPRAPLWLAPDQGVVLDSPHSRALWPQGPVVVRARHLADGAGIRRDGALPGMVAHALTLVEGTAVMAHGLLLLAQDDHDLRRLGAGEAALLRAAIA